MSDVLRGLAAVQAELAKRPQGGGDFEDKPKARYVNVPDGKSVKMVCLQEIDEGSPHYSAKNGTSIFALMHTNPENFKKSAACTKSDGQCYGCDNGWKQKVLLFINVLIDDGSEAPYVAIFNKGLGKGSIAQSLVNMAGDDDFDLSISDKTFKLARNGTGTNTTYTLDALPKPHTLNVEDYELFDLEKYIFTVSYDRQEAYYLDGQAPAEAAPAASSRPALDATAQDAEW